MIDEQSQRVDTTIRIRPLSHRGWRVSHYDWGADRKVLLRLYRALIRSKLDYGSFTYGSARASYIKTLDPIHNQGLRLCLGAFRTSPMESLYVEANEESLYRRRDRLSLQYALRLKSMLTVSPNIIIHFIRRAGLLYLI